jgi:hypothetical protein
MNENLRDWSEAVLAIEAAVSPLMPNLKAVAAWAPA